MAMEAGRGGEIFFGALRGGGGLKGAGILEEMAGDVEVANPAGGTTKLAKTPGGLLEVADWAVFGEQVEESELRLDAAGGGAEEMDRSDFGVGEGKGDGSLKRGDVLAEDVEGLGGLGGVGHKGLEEKCTGSGEVGAGLVDLVVFTRHVRCG